MCARKKEAMVRILWVRREGGEWDERLEKGLSGRWGMLVGCGCCGCGRVFTVFGLLHYDGDER